MEDYPFCIYLGLRRPLRPVKSHFPYIILCPYCDGEWFFYADFDGDFSDLTCRNCNAVWTVEHLFKFNFEKFIKSLEVV